MMMTDTLMDLVTSHNICLRCLGRVYGKKHQFAMDSSIVLAQSYASDITKNLVGHHECQICQGLVEKAIILADRIIENLQKYEFDSFLVGASLTKEQLASDQLLKHVNPEYIDLKFEIRREIGIRISNQMEKQVDFENPDITIVIDGKKGRYSKEVRSLYVLGKYKKFTRGIPQTKWPCTSCKGKKCEKCSYTGQQYPSSVESLVATLPLEEADGYGSSFHGAGREDIDALMLGSGRPFVLELKNPRIRSLDLKALQDEINKQSEIEVSLLRFTDKSMIAYLKEGSPDSKKGYIAQVKFDCELSQQEIEKINHFGSTAVDIKQQTPVRVSHRRADRVRSKMVYTVVASQLDNNTAELRIEAQGGTYIKEFISGDNGRTVPSITQLMGCEAVCTALDVMFVDDKGVFN